MDRLSSRDCWRKFPMANGFPREICRWRKIANDSDLPNQTILRNFQFKHHDAFLQVEGDRPTRIQHREWQHGTVATARTVLPMTAFQGDEGTTTLLTRGHSSTGWMRL